MAVGAVVKDEHDSVESFEDWYNNYVIDPRTGCLTYNGFSPLSQRFQRQYNYYKSEMDSRVKNHYKYVKQAAGEVVSERNGLANVSSGDSAGFIERIAKNIVQHTPNVEITSEFKQDSIQGILAKYFLTHKIIGDDEYSNDMQQNLTSSTELSLTIGFDCVIPVLQQDAKGSWYIQYDNIHYRDVFPEPGAKDVRRAHDVFIRRYLTKGDIKHLIRSQAVGWDIAALKSLLKTSPASREHVSREEQKHHSNPEAYEIITWYSDSGDPFLTFAAQSKLLLRIEKNKHPLKEHPVFFLILKRDAQQPLGKSVLSKTFGRQEFQDLFLNGAMKMWARNVDPPIFGYGTVNAVPNLSPGKYTQISNPNAKVEAFEINTQSLMMFGSISQQNAANMAQLIGNADQQMASQSTGGMMSQTPQGVEAQQQMVDVTTNQFQNAVEAFLSRYLSYALTIYFQELRGIKSLTPDAEAREELINAGLQEEAFDEDGKIKLDLADLAVQYKVKIVPGSLVEMEAEKQTRMLNQMLIPLTQSMPAMAQTGDQALINQATAAVQFIIEKQIELTGSAYSSDVKSLLAGESDARDEIARREALEDALGGELSTINEEADITASVLLAQQQQISLLTEGMQKLMAAQGITTETPTELPPAPTE